MSSLEHPDRPTLALGLIVLVVALYIAHLGAGFTIVGIVVAIPAMYAVLRSLGWSATDRR